MTGAHSSTSEKDRSFFVRFLVLTTDVLFSTIINGDGLVKSQKNFHCERSEAISPSITN